jgi:hypothetical protein
MKMFNTMRLAVLLLIASLALFNVYPSIASSILASDSHRVWLPIVASVGPGGDPENPATPLPATATQPPTETAIPSPTSTVTWRQDPLTCAFGNLAWTEPGRLLRAGRAWNADAFQCLADGGVRVIVDQRMPSEDKLGEPALAARAGILYINLGIPDNDAPSPDRLREWIDTTDHYMAQGLIVLVHDGAGRGRMGYWDAVYFLLHGASAEWAIEQRFLGKGLPFEGAKLRCNSAGNGQLHTLVDIAEMLTGVVYIPRTDEWGNTWTNCPRPAYTIGWDYEAVVTRPRPTGP